MDLFFIFYFGRFGNGERTERTRGEEREGKGMKRLNKNIYIFFLSHLVT